MASHSCLSDEFWIVNVVQGSHLVLKDVLLDLLLKILLILDETRAVRAQLQCDLKCFLFHGELVAINLSVVLLLESLKTGSRDCLHLMARCLY